MALLDYLAELGVNCIELMPMSEFQARLNWGYSTSHYMAIEYAGGGRDQFKHFVRACHRAASPSCSTSSTTTTPSTASGRSGSTTPPPENNIYYWYEGRPGRLPRARPAATSTTCSTGWAPRYWEEQVRRLFICSAAALVSEFHFDGFRVDLTTAIHSDAVLHADGRAGRQRAACSARSSCANGRRTLQPDQARRLPHRRGPLRLGGGHRSRTTGGLGFDASWYSDFYHHLIGDAQNDTGRARLLKFAGYGDDRELRMSWFAGVLAGWRRPRSSTTSPTTRPATPTTWRTASGSTRPGPSWSRSTTC